MVEIALSPCPNDTFIFHAWIEGLVGKDLPLSPTFADIETLNCFALQRQFPLIKLSFSCLKHVLKDYEMLPVGAALGWNVGPKIISKKKIALSSLGSLKMAIPGENTTAHLLARHFAPKPKEKIYCRYHEIGKLLKEEVADCGVIIHESRFTFQREGFYEVADLGTLWHERYHLPLPLGCLAIQKGYRDKEKIIAILQSSLEFAWKNPQASKEFILRYAQEKEEQVIKDHISLYVNEESLSLSPKGKEAIDILYQIS